MNRYKVTRQLGDGTFGQVLKATNKQTGEVVAVKKLKQKFYLWEECLQLQELKSLKKLNHPNIVKLKEVVRENHQLYFVFEFMDGNLLELMKCREHHFTCSEVCSILFQTLKGLSFMHKHGFFHRDIKPENMLMKGRICKIADFGLAREIRSCPPYTNYVSTRWYRAPEVLLRSTSYSSSIDMWAIGCIMAELFILHPFFPGSSEADQLHKICSLLGSPTHLTWPEGMKLATQMRFSFPHVTSTPFSQVIPNASPDAIALLQDLLVFDPQRRPTALQVLQYRILQESGDICAVSLENREEHYNQQQKGLDTIHGAALDERKGNAAGQLNPPSPEILPSVAPQIPRASLNERRNGGFGGVLRDKSSSTMSSSLAACHKVERTIAARSNNKSNNHIPSSLSGTVAGGGGLLPKGQQQGLCSFSSLLKQGNYGLGSDLSCQDSGSYCSTNELDKWSSSNNPCNSASGHAGMGVIGGGARLKQTNQEAGLLSNRPTSGTSTVNIAGGSLLARNVVPKENCHLTSTTVMAEEDTLSEVVGEAYRGWKSRQPNPYHQQCVVAPESGVFEHTPSHIGVRVDSFISYSDKEYRGESRQPEKHVSQSTMPVPGILNTPLSFDIPEDSLSLAAGEMYGGQSSRLPEHFPRVRNMTALGDLSTSTARLDNSTNSLSLTSDSLSLAADETIGKTKYGLRELFRQNNALGSNVGVLCNTDASHLSILEDSDSLSLAAGEIYCNTSPVLHHSKFTSPTFGAP